MRFLIPFVTTEKPTIDRFSGWAFKLAGPIGAAIYLCMSTSLLASEMPHNELTLRRTVELSLQSHPALASYQYRVMSANAYALQAAIGEKPEIHLTLEDGLGTGERVGLDNSQSTLSISWVLQAGLLDQRVKSAQSKTNVLEIERDIQRYDVAAQTAHAFLTVLAYQERLGVALNAQKYALQALKDIQKRVDAGRSPSADKLQAEVNLERRELEVEDIQHELKSAKKILASQWGASSVDFVRASGALTLNEQVISYDTLENGISNNPQVRYFLTQQRVIDTEMTLAREEAKNRWRLNAGVRRYEATEDYALTFGVSLPLGKSTRKRHKISALSAEQARYGADARAKEIQLSTQLYVLYEELQHSYHLNNALTQKILPRLERALVETQKAYSLGKYSYREWYTLQNEVLDTRMELINVRLQAQNNLTEIERLTGLNLMVATSTTSVINNADLNAIEVKNNGNNQ